MQVGGTVAAGGLHVHRHEAGGRGLVGCAKNPETKHPWLSFGHAMYNGGAGRWRGVVVIPHCGDLESVGRE